MPIGQYLEGERFDPETTRIMGIALATARAVLRDQERSDRAEEMIAKNIIALAKTGERDADRERYTWWRFKHERLAGQAATCPWWQRDKLWACVLVACTLAMCWFFA